MAQLRRRSGKKEGGKAILHKYEDQKAKLEIEIDATVANGLMLSAVDHGGALNGILTINGQSFNVSVIGGRIDSIDSDGTKIGGTGVIAFSSLSRDSE
ncbi:hypothetical protein C8J27_10958 [Rhodobacter aestuarii]|uniref:Uncharacterized protein n=1 Tax=Rhodobacter aestuarii TaxID=453582 RepID=A0A1N7PUI0_9RHOB|nr:hypothetical protein [Rhodobacter aestuarii]PTV94160.1 hypothetical protein C8J27_10958 [Rhodobacter aestuarii]SIT14200.1 hypothetical protein SAMN05421580_11177 [Rhodobacter aestuarii]